MLMLFARQSIAILIVINNEIIGGNRVIHRRWGD